MTTNNVRRQGFSIWARVPTAMALLLMWQTACTESGNRVNELAQGPSDAWQSTTHALASAWSQVGQDIFYDIDDPPGDSAGWSVDINKCGNTVVIGELGGDSNFSGQFRAYALDANGSWMQVGKTVYGQPGSGSGWTVKMSDSGTRVAVGAPFGDPPHVQVYERHGNRWVKDGAPMTGPFFYGSSIDMSASGERIVVSSESAQTVGVYERSRPNWKLVGDVLTDPAPGTAFGSDVSINAVGNRIVVNSYYAGRAQVYDLINGQWTAVSAPIQHGPAEPTQPGAASFGSLASLSASGDRLAIADGFQFAAAQGDFTPSTVTVWEFSSAGTVWVQLGQTLTDPVPPDVQNGFGSSVSLSASGNRLVVGAPQLAFPTPDAGFARVFEYDDDDGQWIQSGSDIVPANPMPNDAFGFDVAMSASGSTIVVSAQQEYDLLSDANRPGYAAIYTDADVECDDDSDSDSD